MKIGALLLQLEIVERSQPFGRFATSRIRIGADIRITDAWGDEYVVEPSDSAARILDRLRERRPDLRPADEGSAGAFDDRAGAWPAWNQLLYDLGAREGELVVFAPSLRFRDIAAATTTPTSWSRTGCATDCSASLWIAGGWRGSPSTSACSSPAAATA